jgi:uncharacterized protein YjbI with pentapeptide repeats
MIQGGTEYENQTFGRETSFADGLEGADFTDCCFLGCDFRSARLLGCRFFECRLERVDASAADFTDSTFRGTTFVDSKLLGINWTILRSIDAATWERCLLDGSCYQALQLQSAQWIECRLHEADFDDCNLQKARFLRSELDGAHFKGADLGRTDFSGATGLAFDPRSTRLDKTIVEMDAVLRMASALGLKIAGTGR